MELKSKRKSQRVLQREGNDIKGKDMEKEKDNKWKEKVKLKNGKWKIDKF